MIGKHRTTMETVGDTTRVVFHETCVFRMERLGNIRRVTLNSGGWKTRTTKKRINESLALFCVPLNVRQDAGKWYVGHDDLDIPFEDGIMFDVDTDHNTTLLTLEKDG